MEFLWIILILAVSGTLNIVCFFIGAKVGQTIVQGEPIKTPEINPMKVIAEQREQKAIEEEQNRTNTILENIENYNGTEYGQKDVP